MTTAARATLRSLRSLLGLWASSKLIVSIRFPWAPGEVVDFAAERDGDRLGVRDLWWLGSLVESHRPTALGFLRAGAVVELISIPKDEEPEPPVLKTRKALRA